MIQMIRIVIGTGVLMIAVRILPAEMLAELLGRLRDPVLHKSTPPNAGPAGQFALDLLHAAEAAKGRGVSAQRLAEIAADFSEDVRDLVGARKSASVVLSPASE